MASIGGCVICFHDNIVIVADYCEVCNVVVCTGCHSRLLRRVTCVHCQTPVKPRYGVHELRQLVRGVHRNPTDLVEQLTGTRYLPLSLRGVGVHLARDVVMHQHPDLFKLKAVSVVVVSCKVDPATDPVALEAEYIAGTEQDCCSVL